MEQHIVECLGCGTARMIERRVRGHMDAGECSRCGYVGWAASTDLTEDVRRVLRERPLERRRLRAVA
jgi:Zn ribbon nucleic-acid-binding protein